MRAGNALMQRRDQLDATFEQTTQTLERIDALLDGPLAAAALEAGSGVSLMTLRDIEAKTAQIGYWLTLFKHRPTAAARQHLLDKVRKHHGAIARFAEQPLGAAAQPLRDRVSGMHREVATNIALLLTGETEISDAARQLDALSESIDDIFDNEIQVMLLEDLSEPRKNMEAAFANLQRTLRYLIPLYLLIALATGLLLLRAIITPMRRLAAGTQALGAGDLDYRIAVRGNDELAALARQFNTMAQRLQESTVSRKLLEASEQRLQASVVELRQEISERQQAEREREALQAQLRHSETLAAMGRLVAGVAHEVRNPLFGISSTLDAMQASAEAGRTNPRYHQVLRREVDRLNGLMTDLLEYGRAPPAERAVEPLGKTLTEAIRNCQTAARMAGVEVLGRLEQDAAVLMSRDRLLQVHVNLIENAIQHAPRGSTIIVATQATVDDAGRHWIGYLVMDEGPGFAPEDLAHVFDPFFTRRHKGTGLGLAIARRIVDEHHGVIEPGNRPDGEAVVRVRLPVAPAG